MMERNLFSEERFAVQPLPNGANGHWEVGGEGAR
jgi:hypothetical protein